MAAKARKYNWLLTFWRGKRIGHFVKLGTARARASTSHEARDLVRDRAPAGTDRITALRYGPKPRPLHHVLGLRELLAASEIGDIHWTTLDQAQVHIYAHRAGVRVANTQFIAFPTHQLFRGEDRSACERIRLTRITVLGQIGDAKHLNPATKENKDVIHEPR